MSSETTDQALALLGAVQDPKAARKILEEVRQAQAQLEESRKEFAAEKRECKQIRQAHRRFEAAKLELQAAQLKLTQDQAKLKEDRKKHDQAVKDMADIAVARKQASNKAAFAKRKLKELEQKQKDLDAVVAHNQAVLMQLHNAVRDAHDQLARS